MNQNKIPRNEQGQRHGLWEVYWPNGKSEGFMENYFKDGSAWYKGNYVNGKSEGYSETSNGDCFLKMKEFFLI